MKTEEPANLRLTYHQISIALGCLIQDPFKFERISPFGICNYVMGDKPDHNLEEQRMDAI